MSKTPISANAKSAILAYVDSITPPPIESVWLTGSRARGDNRPDSDWDVIAFQCDASKKTADLFLTNQLGPIIEGGQIELVIAHPCHWTDPRPYMAELRRAGLRLR